MCSSHEPFDSPCGRIFHLHTIFRKSGVISVICPSCGTNNEKGFKFCVKCGSNLENPQEVNYEQVDMGGYHTEEEFSSASRGFTVGNGTFTINDRGGSGSSSSDIYTADELNDTDEEFDFSMYEEPFIPRLDSDRLNLPQAGSEPLQAQQQGYGQPPQMMGGMPNQSAGVPPMGGMPQQGAMGANPYMNPQQMMYGQPQIIGYDPNGMPVYSQAPPMMYGQPQIIGYDQNGMPVYSQAPPIIYGQPQIVGYDPNGMPIYAQPAPIPVQAAPEQQTAQQGGGMQGMPAMPQSPQGGGMQGMPAMQGMPSMPQQGGGMPAMQGMPSMPQQGANSMYGMPALPKAPAKQEQEELVDVSEDFWKFFDGGSATKHRESNPEDFFGKSHGMGDLGGMRQNDKKKNSYMSDTPIVDGGKLAHNEVDKFNKFYMRNTDTVNAEDLAENTHVKAQDRMGVTRQVDADRLSEKLTGKSRITMYTAGEANADTLEAYVPERQESMMNEDLSAVEALPKKKNPYESELDKIELPEYMQAKKTVREETIEIPSLPQMGTD